MRKVTNLLFQQQKSQKVVMQQLNATRGHCCKNFYEHTLRIFVIS
jgi:hypothetical protein